MATIRQIVKLPDARLRHISAAVSEGKIHSPSFSRFIDDMISTMWHADGIGIAAVQVGIMDRAVIITRGGEPIALINPEILSRSLRRQTEEEGCLSVPGFYGPVRRSYRVRVQALDIDGQLMTLIASGLTARIIQHEMDHINGVLFVDRSRKVMAVT